MNRRQAIKAGITATAAILTITGCKSKEEPKEQITIKCKGDGKASESTTFYEMGWPGAKERYGRSPGLEAINDPTRQWAESMAQASNKSTDDILIKAIEVI